MVGGLGLLLSFQSVLRDLAGAAQLRPTQLLLTLSLRYPNAHNQSISPAFTAVDPILDRHSIWRSSRCRQLYPTGSSVLPVGPGLAAAICPTYGWILPRSAVYLSSSSFRLPAFLSLRWSSLQESLSFILRRGSWTTFVYCSSSLPALLPVAAG